jgi:hypothetical protein
MMPTDRYDRFLSANLELRGFLERVDALVHGAGEVDAGNLGAIGRLLDAMAPEIGETSHGISGDAVLEEQIQEYISNLRRLQASLEQVRCVMFARLAQIGAARQHMIGLQGWANAYRQTA